MEREGEFATKASTAVAKYGETEPVLLHLIKFVPTRDEPLIELRESLFAQEAELAQNPLMQLLIGVLAAIEKQKGVNKERQV